MRHLVICSLLLCAQALIAVDSPTIAVLDLEHFLKNAKLLTSRYERLQGELDGYNTRFKEMEKTIKKLETRIGMTEKSDSRYGDLVQDLEVQKLRYKMTQQQAEKLLSQKKATILNSSIEKAMIILESYCRDKDVDIVLQTGGKEADSEVPVTAMPVLFRTPQFDITDDFIAYANARFEDANTQAAAGEQPAAVRLPVVEALPDAEESQ